MILPPGHDARIFTALTGDTPYAVYAYTQPGFDELPAVAIYTVYGGASDRSSVSAETLQALGIAVPERKAA